MNSLVYVDIDQQGPGHSLGEKIKLHEMKNEKNYVGSLMIKNMANFKGFY